MSKLVTKANMITALNDPREGFQIQYIGKALVAIFGNQTQDEKSANSVDTNNNIGFASCDSRDGCITAKYFIKHNTLLDFQVENWLAEWRGAPRITKYHRQLNDIATSKSFSTERNKREAVFAPIYTHDQDTDQKHVFVGNTVSGLDVYYSIKFSEIIIRHGDLPQEYRAMDMIDAERIPAYDEFTLMVHRYLNLRHNK